MIMNLIKLLLKFHWLKRWYYLVIILFFALLISIGVFVLNLPFEWLIFKPVLIYSAISFFFSISLARVLDYILVNRKTIYSNMEILYLQRISIVVGKISFFSVIMLVIANFFKF